jgi:hypothetical protein
LITLSCAKALTIKVVARDKKSSCFITQWFMSVCNDVEGERLQGTGK